MSPAQCRAGVSPAIPGAAGGTPALRSGDGASGAYREPGRDREAEDAARAQQIALEPLAGAEPLPPGHEDEPPGELAGTDGERPRGDRLERAAGRRRSDRRRDGPREELRRVEDPEEEPGREIAPPL